LNQQSTSIFYLFNFFIFTKILNLTVVGRLFSSYMYTCPYVDHQMTIAVLPTWMSCSLPWAQRYTV